MTITLEVSCREGLQASCATGSLRASPQDTVRMLLPELGLAEGQVDLVLVEGRPLGLDAPIGTARRLELFPPLPLPDGEAEGRSPRFVADAHLGRLASYLRMLGFDTLYGNDLGDDYLSRIALSGQRLLLSRDRALLARVGEEQGRFVAAIKPRQQLTGLVQGLALCPYVRPFSRCLRCNGRVREVAKEEVEGELPEMTPYFFGQFWRCESCGRLYWKGAHYPRMRALVRSVLAEACGV